MIKWGGQLPIETPRLTLVPMQEEDGADLFAYYTEEIAHYQYPKPYGSPEEAVREILQFAEGDSVGSVLFTLRDRKNQFLGVADIHGLSDREPEVGVWIRKEFWRQGYAVRLSARCSAITGKRAMPLSAGRRTAGIRPAYIWRNRWAASLRGRTNMKICGECCCSSTCTAFRLRKYNGKLFVLGM